MDIALHVEARKVFGKKVKKLRQKGLIPAEIYGQGTKNYSIQIPKRDLAKALNKAGNTNVISIEVGSEDSVPVLARNIQYAPIGREIIHVDFYAVDMNKTVQVNVPIHIIGDNELLREGGTLVTGINLLEIEALPQDIPDVVEVDMGQISSFSESILVETLDLGDKITIHSSESSMLISIQPPRLLEEELEDEELEGEELEGEEGETDEDGEE